MTTAPGKIHTYLYKEVPCSGCGKPMKRRISRDGDNLSGHATEMHSACWRSQLKRKPKAEAPQAEDCAHWWVCGRPVYERKLQQSLTPARCRRCGAERIFGPPGSAVGAKMGDHTESTVNRAIARLKLVGYSTPGEHDIPFKGGGFL